MVAPPGCGIEYGMGSSMRTLFVPGNLSEKTFCCGRLTHFVCLRPKWFKITCYSVTYWTCEIRQEPVLGVPPWLLRMWDKVSEVGSWSWSALALGVRAKIAGPGPGICNSRQTYSQRYILKISLSGSQRDRCPFQPCLASFWSPYQPKGGPKSMWISQPSTVHLPSIAQIPRKTQPWAKTVRRKRSHVSVHVPANFDGLTRNVQLEESVSHLSAGGAAQVWEEESISDRFFGVTAHKAWVFFYLRLSQAGSRSNSWGVALRNVSDVSETHGVP